MLGFILNLFKLIFFAIVFFIAVIIVYQIGMAITGQNHNKAVVAPKIISVTNETKYINQNYQFSLPTTLPAEMSDKTSKAVPVVWNANNVVSTANAGTHTYIGTIQGYKSKVNYTLTSITNPETTYFDDVNVINTMVNYKVPVDLGNLWVMLQVSKGTQSFQETLPVVNGIFSNNLYLPFGAGTYSVVESTRNDNTEFGDYIQQASFNIYNLDTRDMTGLMPSKYVESDSPEIIKLANTITKDSYSDFDKASAIHDWVTNNIAYDMKNKNSTAIEYSALVTLHNRIATCNGYANLYAALSRAVGLRTKIIGGTATDGAKDKPSGRHAWNESFVNNKWINIDTTWDAGGYDSSNKFVPDPESTYFNMSDNDFSKTHTKTSEYDYSD